MNEAITQTIINIEQGAKTALIDANYSSNLAYKPQFISNDYKTGRKVLSSIEEELANCESFMISVAFITMSGITPLLQTLKELETKGIRGKILTTDYLTFSEPKALDKLASLQNIELKMYRSKEAKHGFHTKGYLFQRNGSYSIIVGSSNMTLSALTCNKEWNTKLVSTEQGEYAKNVLAEFDSLWDSEYAVSYENFIQYYSKEYELVKEQKRIAKEQKVVEIEQYKLHPNMMQVAFIKNLNALRENGAERALLISATGTGKTYASAFALREENPKKALFIVHREQIAKQAMKSYKKVFGATKRFGLLSGNYKDYEADYLFATMQMMSKKDVMEQFAPDTFDTIIIDEVHRAGAESYQRIMSYFEPEFWLGMTASPERMDGFNIFELFDYNIAYEIRLGQALEEDLLCPFHYFGITEMDIDGQIVDDNTSFNYLVHDDRVDHIIEKAKYFGYSGNRVKGLVFCRNINDGKALSEKFNERGYRTVFLSGDDSQEVREKSIERLTQESDENRLDYIFTVDIFNEGVDIPEVNQVIMLRPTQSPVVFVQQLGRGLRKAEDKEYVVILDFIGNYENNFMIPIALSGDRSYNKDTIRKYVREGSRIIPGGSTIHFDEISKKRIFDAIDKTNIMNSIAFLKEKYIALKNKLGKVPSILDFYEYGEIDPMLFIEKERTYDSFVRKVDKDYTTVFLEQDETVLDFVSQLLINGKRPHELIMLQLLMEKESFTKIEFKERLIEIGEIYREEDYRAAINVLSLGFINAPSDKKRYESMRIIDTDTFVKERMNLVGTMYQKMNQAEFKMELSNLIQYGLKKWQNEYKNHDEDNLVLYKKYSRKDVCRLLNWEKDESSTMYGYRNKYNTCPIFVTYEKKEDISSSTKYDDQFINPQLFSWMTRSNVTLESKESQSIINHKENGLKIYLFVKKSDGEGTDFYYMGKVEPVSYRQTVIQNDKGKDLPIVNFELKLEHEVRSDIYDYFAN